MKMPSVRSLAKSLFGTFAIVLVLAGIGHAQVFTTDFSTDAWDADFVQTSQVGASVAWNSTNHTLSNTGTGTQNVLFNTTATGGTGGSGGTSAATANNNVYSGVTISTNFEMNPTAGSSLGIWGNVNSTATAGYLGYLRFTGSTGVELRLYPSTANPTTNSLGTASVDQTFTLGTALNSSTFYQERLQISDIGSNVTLTLSLLDATGTNTLASISTTDVGSSLLSGQVGFRLASTLTLDSVSISPVPEPSSVALVGSVGFGFLLLLRVGRRRQA